MARIQVRRTRRAENRNFRLTEPHWVDPYPFIPGTEPEKRIFEGLMKRKIYFQFQADLPELSQQRHVKLEAQIKKLETEIRALIREVYGKGKPTPSGKAKVDKKIKELRKLQQKLVDLNWTQRQAVSGAFLFQPGFKPDFVLPEYRVIIDPFGIFHHSLPGAVERDQIKAAVYHSLGYAFYHPWWDDKGFLWAEGNVAPLKFERIGYDVNLLLDRMAEIRRGPTVRLTDPVDIAAKKNPGYLIGKNIGAGASSVAIANKLRTRAKVLGISQRGRRKRRRTV